MLEIDDGNLADRLHAATAAIDNRVHELQMDHGGTLEEGQAISDALAGLNVLRRELEQRSARRGPSEI